MHLPPEAATSACLGLWVPPQVRWMMEADGYRPQGSVWGSLITACGKAGQLGSAEALWLEMHAAGVEPTEHHYQALMNASVWTFQVLLSQQPMPWPFDVLLLPCMRLSVRLHVCKVRS